MHNLDRYIADFFSSHKKFSAQGIGEFAIANGQAPNGAPLVAFVPNKNAYTSEELVAYVAETEGKNKIVTGFSLEAHFNEAKQFINIGTPWLIPGYGQLQLGKTRELEFVQQMPTESLSGEKGKRRQPAEQEFSYEDGVTAPARTANTGAILLTLLIVLALGAGGYYFYASRNMKEPVVVTTTDTANITDTVVALPAPVNTTDTTDSTQTSAASVASASTTEGYKFILNRTNNTAYALKRFNQLKSYGTKVYVDSTPHRDYTSYKIYLVQNVTSSDTSRIKDSLTKYYGREVIVEK